MFTWFTQFEYHPSLVMVAWNACFFQPSPLVRVQTTSTSLAMAIPELAISGSVSQKVIAFQQVICYRQTLYNDIEFSEAFSPPIRHILTPPAYLTTLFSKSRSKNQSTMIGSQTSPLTLPVNRNQKQLLVNAHPPRPQHPQTPPSCIKWSKRYITKRPVP